MRIKLAERYLRILVNKQVNMSQQTAAVATKANRILRSAREAFLADIET